MTMKRNRKPGVLSYGNKQKTGMRGRIRAVRLALDMTQAEFAAPFGISGNTYSGIESGIGSPTIKTLYLLTTVYNVDSEYILHGTGEMFKGNDGLRKSVSQPPEDIFSYEDVQWYAAHSPLFRSAVTAKAGAYLFENRDQVLANAADYKKRKTGK